MKDEKTHLIIKASGCPYCGVKFRMEDLSERVSSFALRKDYQLLETIFQGKLYAYAKTIIFVAALFMCSLAVWWIDPLDGLTANMASNPNLAAIENAGLAGVSCEAFLCGGASLDRCGRIT